MTTAYLCIGLLGLPAFLLGLWIAVNRGIAGSQSTYGTLPRPLGSFAQAHPGAWPNGEVVLF